jgi:hypothetical protein
MTRLATAWLAVGVAAAGCGGGPAPALLAPAPVVVPVSGEPGAFSPSGDRHPGQIVYDDHVEGRTWTRNAIDVPATIAWVMVRGRWRPVVLVEIDGAGQHREITTYGPDRELLERTTARLAVPPPRIAPEPPRITPPATPPSSPPATQATDAELPPVPIEPGPSTRPPS